MDHLLASYADDEAAPNIAPAVESFTSLSGSGVVPLTKDKKGEIVLNINAPLASYGMEYGAVHPHMAPAKLPGKGVTEAHMDLAVFDREFVRAARGGGFGEEAEAAAAATESRQGPRAPAAKKRRRDPFADRADGAAAGPVDHDEDLLTPEQRAFLGRSKALDAAVASALREDGDGEAATGGSRRGGGPTSIFHGKSVTDYQGRTYMHPPAGLRPVDHACFVPQSSAAAREYKGHGKGVARIRLLPTTGHLLLSAGMDNILKIWDVEEEHRCLRTFTAHDKAVRDVCLSNNGRAFVSASHDRTCKMWDTETGQVTGVFSLPSVPTVVKLNPDEDKQGEFLVGCQDKKVYQYDSRTGEVVQTYDRHLGSITSLTFINENRLFVSSSEDNSLRVWEYGIPVETKIVSEPWMHSMPAITPHPNGNNILCQSLDNQILVYNTDGKFKLNNKKRFVGHLPAGYACEVAVSPDGQWVTSGDGEGKFYVWSWKTCKIVKQWKAHDQVTIGAVWHPIHTSRVFTCSWDASIKMWE
jgi:hypothetical protein